MEKVTASNQIVEISESTSLKINMWARIIKWIILIPAIIMGLVGIGLIYAHTYTRLIGVALIVIAVVNAFISFFVVYLLRALAIITEACSIFVLEHQEKQFNGQ